MFLEFYGLKEQPFGVTPDPHFICPSRTHSKAFNSLSRGLEAGCGFLALIAKPGMGKTTLVLQLLKQLEQTSRTVFLFQTQCDSRELLRYLLGGLGLDAAGQDIVAMHERLYQVLARELLAGRRFVLVIDECQNLENSVLETVRLLSDFETAKAKLIQIVLVGQPQLADKLSSPSLAQLSQRISVLCGLEPLTRAEIVEYIEHRLQVAGYAGTPLFTVGALEKILAHSEGVPRSINTLCFNALLAGCIAGRKQIDSAILDQVLTDLDMSVLKAPHSAAQAGSSAAVPRRAGIPHPGIFKADLGRTPADRNDAGEVVLEFEVAPAEPALQVAQPQEPPPAQRSPRSSAEIPGGDVSDGAQVGLGSRNLLRATENSEVPQRLCTVSAVPRFSSAKNAESERPIFEGVHPTDDRAVQVGKVLPESGVNPPLRKPYGADSLVRKQVARTSMDNAAHKTTRAGGMVTFAPQASVFSYPVAPKRSWRRRVEGPLALGAALALVGLLSFYSKAQGNRQLQDQTAGAVAHDVPPVPPSQGLGMRQALTQPLLTWTLGLKVSRIVIDPGHGGRDTGVIGPMGLTEKDLCLDVALRLGRIIDQRLPGAEVVFTRIDDAFVPLKDRIDLANEKKGDLFLSIHANSSPNHVDRGVETYYLNLTGGPTAMEVAARENATAQETESDLQELVKKIASSEKNEESRKFAEDIQNSLSRYIQDTAKTVKSRGVRRAPFAVLAGANMPSVLTEISFLSNPSDEQLLTKEEYRQQLAEGLYQGVQSYLRSLNGVTYPLPARNPTVGRSGFGAFSDGPAAIEASRNQH